VEDQRLGISLLELNTFGHAVCTLAIYLAWWKKPLDVAQHVRITLTPGGPNAQERRQLVAAMCMKSRLDGSDYEDKVVRTVRPRNLGFNFDVPIERKGSSKRWTISTRVPRQSTAFNLAKDKLMYVRPVLIDIALIIFSALFYRPLLLR